MSTAFENSALRGATLYFDCFAGIAGDMTLAALLDLGVPEPVVRRALGRLPLSAYELKVHAVRKGAFVAKKVDVVEPALQKEQDRDQGHDHGHGHGHDHDHPPELGGHHHPHDHGPEAEPHHDAAGHPHVHYGQIRAMLTGAFLAGGDDDVLVRALAMFDRLAEVEAALHGVAVAEVFFHEVGALDSIVDIVGTAAALSWLKPRRIVARRVPLGSGQVRTAHGLLPVPAPATLALLKGVPVEEGGAACELTTPTGAVILAANASAYGFLPTMRVVGIGYGAGTRELADRPNLLRVVAGHEEVVAGQSQGAPGAAAGCLVVEANIDDMNPQLYEPLGASLFQAGALDVWLTPVQMKKGRPGVLIAVLVEPSRRSDITAVLLRESTTLGVRVHAVERHVLLREIVEVQTEFGMVAVKLGRDPQSGSVWNVAPEFSVCAERARAHNVPIKNVIAAAVAAFHRR